MQNGPYKPKTEAFTDNSLRFYSQNAIEYADKTMMLNMEGIYPFFLQYIPPNGKVLDAGCGSGRDSLYFLRHGYQVAAFDASAEMCREAERRLLQPVQQLKFEQLACDSMFDGVWACASLVHIPWSEQGRNISKLLQALKPGGVLYASWKYGSNFHTEGCRCFCDMDEKRVAEVTKQLKETQLLEQWISFGIENTEQKWLNTIFQRR